MGLIGFDGDIHRRIGGYFGEGIVKSRRAAPKVERTKPGSENEYRVEYADYKRWTNDRPGDGVDSDHDENLRKYFSRPNIKRSLKKLEKATGEYLKSGKKKPVTDAIESMRIQNGKEVSLEVLRQVYKMEKEQLEKKESEQQKKIVEVLDMAKDKMRNASEEMIGRVVKRITADYGDVEFHMNVFNFFETTGNADRETVSLMQDVVSDALFDSARGIRKMVEAKVKRDRRLKELMARGVTLK